MRILVFALIASSLLSAAARKQVWIDTDPSVAPGGHEVDDGIALLQAFRSPELDIRGISIVHGNADLPTATRIGKDIVQRFGPKNMKVFVGAAGAEDLGTENDATRALAQQLKHGHLTILALGPATNIGTVVRNHPDLALKIDEVIAVAARRPEQHFTAGPHTRQPLRDFNFEKDPEAFEVLLKSHVRLTFAPWEISSQVWITADDVRDLAAKNPGIEYMRAALEDWLKVWQQRFGATGFNPFDTLAIGYLVDRSDLVCDAFAASIETAADDTLVPPDPAREKPYLLVRPQNPNRRTVQYCYEAKPGFKVDLLRRLGAKAPGSR